MRRSELALLLVALGLCSPFFLIHAVRMDKRKVNRVATLAMPSADTSAGEHPSEPVSPEPIQARVQFDRDIEPILTDRCYSCHGPDAGTRRGNLRLDKRTEAIKTAIVSRRSAASPLMDRLSSQDPDEIMPPPRSNKAPLTQAQLELIRQWIDEGAEYEQHWAFKRPERPALPLVKNANWVRNPIDSFIAASHQRQGLAPAAEADRRTLIRRLNFDLIGLPPTPQEVSAFVDDRSADAYEKVVDRLFASPHYGERMAVLWLDLVRYADTDGYSFDSHRETWMYRDYVIASFNDNKPFDRFTVEQLAGDLLPAATANDQIASCYNRLLMTSQEGCADPKEYTARYSADRVRNVSTVWLGVTMGCAECHDHKFDPITTKEFYRLAACFADIQERPVGKQELTPFPSREQATKLRQLNDEIARLEYDPKRQASVVEQRNQLLATIPSALTSLSGPCRVVRILPRGNWADDSGPVVTPGLPACLSPPPARNRLELARWLVSRDNPLVARVMVNRLWKIGFGQGLVHGPDDFGTQGPRPTHAELLDWLAVEFIESGWDVKAMLKRLVMSSTYRQSSTENSQTRERDPDNLLVSHQNPFRLDSEFVRDNALAVSGLLSPSSGGPSVKPYQPEGFWTPRFTEKNYSPDTGEKQHRRGVYIYWCRNFLHPSLQAFDAPTRQLCTTQRGRSTTPLQALVLLNDPTQAEAARALAARILREAGPSTDARLNHACQLVQSRAINAQEAVILTRLLDKHTRQFNADIDAAKQLVHVGESPVPDDVDVVTLAAWTSVARVLLNLHDTNTRN